MHHKRTESQASKLTDIIVIGAGLSGLSAAKVCHDKGLNVLVLEARDRVGGRTLSDDSGCDLGGSYFIQDHRNLFNLIAELGLKCQADVPAAIGGTPAFYSNETRKRFRCEEPNRIPFTSKYNIFTRLDYLATKRKINELCAQIDLSEPWKSKNAKELDSKTFKSFIDDTCRTKEVRNFFLNFITPVNLTNDAEDCSLLFALCFIRSWGGIERCIGISSSGTSRVVGGSQLLSVRLWQQIGEERVLLNKPVHTIDQTRSDHVVVTTRDGGRFEASRVIVALPPSIQTTISFKPSIPLKSQLNLRTPAGLCTKVILYYDRAYWYENGFDGHLFVIDKRLTGSKKRPVDQDKFSDDCCPISFATPDYSRGEPSLIAHVCGSAWVRYHQIEKVEDRIASVAKSYAHILHPKLAKPKCFKELDWVSEEFSRGAYTSIMTPGTMTKFGQALSAPFGRVAFACTELSTYWPGTMEGAIRSGRKAALKILKDLQRIDFDEADILDDEEVPIQMSDSLIEKHANKLLLLSSLTVKVPLLILAASLLGFSLRNVTMRCSLSI